jgi:iron complex outermembrane receptor protein
MASFDALPPGLPARAAIAIACLVAAFDALAQQGPRDAVTLDSIQVTATRTPQSGSGVAASVSVVAGADYRTDARGINLSEKLDGVPGILARDRQNYAQDEQISIRGFGARATFGIRGVRLYVDGVPATMPDGQGQVSNFDLAAGERVEVLRGPFSALYGNSSGGVVQLFTAQGAEPSEQAAAFTYGSFATRRASTDARGLAGGVGYALDATGFETGGFRAHSAAGRYVANARFDLQPQADAKLTVLFNAVSIPRALDPLGLTRDQFAADPRQANAVATQFDTRKSVHQELAAAIFEQDVSGSVSMRALAYRGERDVTQFLAIPVVAQANPLSGGGVVALASPFGGADLRWIARGTFAGRTLETVAGIAWDAQDQHRQGFENFVGATLGVVGALRRDEQDRVTASGAYAQATWNADGELSLFAGLRRSAVRFDSRDRFVTSVNPDDSGRLSFSATTPVAGASWHIAKPAHVYASYGEGFETPTFDELGYRPDGLGGLDFALRPARSRNREIGLKVDIANRLQADVAGFRADTRDELAIDTNSGGRTTYQNVGRARREGAELALSAALGARWRMRFAYTYLDARFRDAFATCLGTPCPAPDAVVPAGTRIPGVPRSFASAVAEWGGSTGLRATFDARYVGSIGVDNAATDFANPYAVFGARVGYGIVRARADLRVFAGIDNLFDRRYAGSVIVNESNGRFFEPAPGRTYFVGLELRHVD